MNDTTNQNNIKRFLNKSMFDREFNFFNPVTFRSNIFQELILDKYINTKPLYKKISSGKIFNTAAQKEKYKKYMSVDAPLLLIYREKMRRKFIFIDYKGNLYFDSDGKINIQEIKSINEEGIIYEGKNGEGILEYGISLDFRCLLNELKALNDESCIPNRIEHPLKNSTFDLLTAYYKMLILDCVKERGIDIRQLFHIIGIAKGFEKINSLSVIEITQMARELERNECIEIMETLLNNKLNEKSRYYLDRDLKFLDLCRENHYIRYGM